VLQPCSTHYGVYLVRDSSTCRLLVQMSIIQLYLKRKHRWTDACFNEQCALNHSSRGPGNF
jgi:hypothetical protein